MKSNKIIESSISLMLAHPGPQGPSAPGASVARSVSINENSSRLREGRGCGDLEDVCIQIKNTQQTRLQLPSASGPAGWKPRSEAHQPSPLGTSQVPALAACTGSSLHLFSPTLSSAALKPHLLTSATCTVPSVSLTQSSPLIGCRRCRCPHSSLLSGTGIRGLHRLPCV